MADQKELVEDAPRESLRQKFRDRAKGRRDVTPPRLVDEMLKAKEVTDEELARYARRGLVKEAQDTLNEINRETGVPDFEKLPGSEYHGQIDLFTYDEYSGRILELVAAAEDDLGKIRARLDYCKLRFHKQPRMPQWFVAWSKGK